MARRCHTARLVIFPAPRYRQFFLNRSTRLASCALQSFDRGWSACSIQIRAAKADGIHQSRLNLRAQQALAADLSCRRARGSAGDNVAARGVWPLHLCEK